MKGPCVSYEIKDSWDKFRVFWNGFVGYNRIAVQSKSFKNRSFLSAILFYEKCMAAFEKTLNAFPEFLHLSSIGGPAPFTTGKTYLHLYAQKKIVAATRLVERLAAPSCWAMVRHYYEDKTSSHHVLR